MDIKPNKKFDAIICGNTPGALILTKFLKSQNKNVALAVEQPDAKSLESTISKGWVCQYSFFPNREKITSSLSKIKSILPGLEFQETKNHDCITFEAGFKSFLGFGDTSIEAANHYVPFFENTEVKTQVDWPETSKALIQELNESILWGHELTAVDLKEGFSQLTFNGKLLYQTEHVYYGLSIQKLEDVFEETKAAKPLLQKIKKSNRWTCLSIIFEHSLAFEPKMESHILMGAKQIPTLGRFFKKETGVTSVWFSFIPEELSLDDDYVAGIIKEIKRQLKRAYPEEFEKKLTFKTSVGPYQVGQIDPAQNDLSKNNIPPGWHMFESCFGPFDGLAGDIFNVASLIELQS